MYAQIAIAADSKTAAYVQFRLTGGIIFFDLVTGDCIRTISAQEWRINSFNNGMHFSLDGNLIALGCKTDIFFGATAPGKLKFTLTEPMEVHAISPFFDNGTKIACLDGTCSIDIWWDTLSYSDATSPFAYPPGK